MNNFGHNFAANIEYFYVTFLNYLERSGQSTAHGHN